MRAYVLRTSGSVDRSLERLPAKVATAAVEFMTGPLLLDPWRRGKALGQGLAGWRSARLGQHRIVYWIDEDAGVVQVERVEHRADVYRPR